MQFCSLDPVASVKGPSNLAKGLAQSSNQKILDHTWVTQRSRLATASLDPNLNGPGLAGLSSLLMITPF